MTIPMTENLKQLFTNMLTYAIMPLDSASCSNFGCAVRLENIPDKIKIAFFSSHTQTCGAYRMLDSVVFSRIAPDGNETVLKTINLRHVCKAYLLADENNRIDNAIPCSWIRTDRMSVIQNPESKHKKLAEELSRVVKELYG